MWAAHHLLAAWHLISDDTTPSTLPSGGGGGGTPSTGLIESLAGTGALIVVGYLTFLGNRTRNRSDRADQAAASEKTGEVSWRLGQLEGHREDEQHAREILDGKVDDHETRISELEASVGVVPVPPHHPARRPRRKPPAGK